MTEFCASDRVKYIKKYGTNSYSSVLLYEDMAAFPLTSTEGFIGYRNGRNMLLVVGEPVCAPEYYRGAMVEFIDHCQRENKQFIQICCGESFKEAVKELDLSAVHIGEDFIFDATSYAPRGDRTKMVRLARNHAIRAGVIVKEYDPRAHADPVLEEAFNAVAQRWVKKTSQFTAHMIDLNIFEGRECKRYFYAEAGGVPVGIIVCLPIHGREGFLLEDVIRDPAAPYGSIELITLTILETIKANGGKMATFGVSPWLDDAGFTGTSRVFLKVGIWAANRMFKLHKLYHFRKKFYATHTESTYLIKYPKGFKLLDIWRILSLF